MKKANDGFILLITLVFILIFSGTLLTLLKLATWSQIELKQRLHQLNTQTAINQAFKLAHLKSACRYDTLSPNSIINKPVSWWHMRCKINKQTYYYYEDLGVDNCASSQLIGSKQTDIIHYYRITIKYLNAISQETYTKSEHVDLPCQSRIHLVKLGMQSYREL